MIQTAAMGACAGLIYLRIKAYAGYGFKILWWAETALFASFLTAFLVRLRPMRRSRGAREILPPMIAAALPMALVHWPKRGDLFALVSLNPAFSAIRPLARLYLALIIGGHLIACLGVISLRRSFSITPEARRLETRGLYRWIRHPIYVGELTACLGITLLRFYPRNCALYILFAALQGWRAGREEDVLATAFPEYAGYRARTGL